MPQQVQIYGLIDPRDRRIHYVGSSVDAFVRLDGHMKDGSDTPKTRWVSELKIAGIQPDLTILATVDASDRYIEEYKWIYLGKAIGWPLTNTVAMRTEKYTDIADGISEKVFVELDRGLTWNIIKMSILDWRSLPTPWDIRHAMFTSFTALLAAIIAVAAVLLGDWVSEPILTTMAALSASMAILVAIPVFVSMFAGAIDSVVELTKEQRLAIEQKAKAQVQQMVEDETNKMFVMLQKGLRS